MRHLKFASLTTLALGVTLALSACGENKDHKTRLQKTFGAGGRGGAAKFNAKSSSCPHLDEVFKRLHAQTDGFLLNSYDYDLETDLKNEKTTDELDRLINFRALRGSAAPLAQTAITLNELTLSPPLDGLADVKEQKNCESVTFSSGDVFRIVDADAHSITLLNEESLETRVYRVSDREILIKQILPQRLNACDRSAQFERSEAITLRLAWGEAAGQVKLAPTYAARLGAPATVTPATPEAPVKIGARSRLAPKPAPPAAASMSLMIFEKLVREATAKAQSLKCPS